jgi:hypothetical protein
MLLSFERPARRRPLEGHQPRVTVGWAHLFADLENCTVANETGITERELSSSHSG